MTRTSIVVLAGLCGTALGAPQRPAAARAPDPVGDSVASVLVQAPPLDVAAIQHAVGLRGVMRQGVLEVTRPRSALRLQARGFAVAAGRVARAAFAGHEDVVVVLADVPVTPVELPRVLRAAREGGLAVPAVSGQPGADMEVVSVHLAAVGDARRLGRAVREVFAALAPPDAGDIDDGHEGPDLDAHALDQALGSRGELVNGVYTARLLRKHIAVGSSRVSLPGPLAEAFLSIQGSPERAALIGDLTVVSDELGGVLRVLHRAKLRVGALFNPLKEQPRVFRVHFWGTGRAQALAAAVRRALAATRR